MSTPRDPRTPPAAESVSPAELRARAASGAVTVSLRNIGVRALGLAGTVVLARLLEPPDFGLLALGLTVVSVGHLIAAGGLGAELIRREQPPSKAELASVTGLQLILGVTLVGGAALVSFVVGGRAPVAAIMTLSLPLFVLRTPSIVLLERNLQFGLIAKAQVLELFVYNLAAIGLVVAGAGVWGVAAAAAAHPLLGSGLLIARGPVGLLMPRIDLAAMRPVLRFGIAFQSVQLSMGLRDQSVNVLIAAVAGTAALGVWAIAYRALQVVFVLVQTSWSVGFASMARLVQARQAEGPLIEEALKTSAVSVGLLASAVAGTAPALVPALFGEVWTQAIDVLPWGAAALMISGPVSISLMGFLFAHGEASRVLIAVVAEGALWLAVIAALLPSMGPQAVGVGMFASAVAFTLLMGRAARRRASFSIFRQVVTPSTCAVMAGACGWLVAGAIASPTLGLVASGATTLGIYLGLAVLLVRDELLRLVRVLLRTVRPPRDAPEPRPVG